MYAYIPNFDSVLIDAPVRVNVVADTPISDAELPPKPSLLLPAWDTAISSYDDNQNQIVSNSGEGAKCKVEIISRSELLRARGYKLPEDDLVIENLYAESTETLDGDDFDYDYDGPIDAGDVVEQTIDDTTLAG